MSLYTTSNTRFVVTLLALAALFQTQAHALEFSPAIDVTATQGAGIFHHVESSGRRNIAVSNNTVAIAWEDNRNDTPHIFLARKPLSASAFVNEIKISNAGEAYEPSIVALDNDRFAVAWEEDAHTYVRLIGPKGMGPKLKVHQQSSSQISLAVDKQHLFLVYSSHATTFPSIRLQQLAIAGQALRTVQDCAVDSAVANDDQSYPTLMSLNDKLVVAWEDRRPGHTIIMAAQSSLASPCRFSKPQRVSAGHSGNKKRRSVYGKGHGVARVALANHGDNNAVAVWADKRIFREGYDIYAARYQANNKTLFGLNEKVQDSFGGFAQQWHPTVTGDAGNLVVAWDDNRDGNANIMLSWLQDNQWSDDTEASVATGPGEQTHPSITLDNQGNLHLVWLDRAASGGPTRLRYAVAKSAKK